MINISNDNKIPAKYDISYYIGIPFLSKGRDANIGLDCYGLISLYYKNELSIVLPEIATSSNAVHKVFSRYLDQISKNYYEIKTPQNNCIVAMNTTPNYPDIINHFGIYIEDKTTNTNQILHTLKNTQSHLINSDDIRIKHTIKGYYLWHC